MAPTTPTGTGLIERQGAVPTISPKTNGRWEAASTAASKNAIEHMFCCFKGCRRLATRFDRTAAVFLGSIHLAASVMWFL
ncbi:transposase [Sphingomonas sp. 22176]|uniref:transposase n=1 Tax=Sphingomonas sp. 22176 TaxID=3453884 RepID=UPI003F836F74